MKTYELYNYYTGKFTGIQKLMLETHATEYNNKFVRMDLEVLWIEVI